MAINNEFFKKVNYTALGLVVISLPFSIRINSICLVLFFVSAITFFTKRDRMSLSLERRKVLIFIAHFLVYLGVVVFSGFNNGFVLEKKITILLFPIFLSISVSSLDDFKIELLLFLFVGSTLVASLIPFYNRLDLLIHPSITIQEFLVMDRPYFALYSFFCVIIMIYMMIKYKKNLIRIACLLVGLYFAYFTYVIFAKMAFVAFFFTVIFCTGIYLVQEKRFKNLALLITGLFFFFLAVVLSNSQINSFFHNLVQVRSFDLSEGKWVYFSSINTRYVIWNCNLKLLVDGYHWILGCGLDYQNILDACYSQNWDKYGIKTSEGIDPVFLQSHFNPHNEFLQTWIETGILGLLAILASISLAIKIGLQKRNYLYLAFTILFFICCLTESMLTRQKGIVLYALFNSLFAFQMRGCSSNGKMIKSDKTESGN